MTTSRTPDLSFLARRADGDPTRTRRVLTHDEALALAESALQIVTGPVKCMIISQRATAVTKIVNNNYIRCSDRDELELEFNTKLGSTLDVTIGTNVRDAATLRQAIRNAEIQKTPPPRSEDRDPDDPDDPRVVWAKPKQYVPTSLWHDSTARAMATMRGETLANMATQMRALRDKQPAGTSPLTMAATVAVCERARLCHYTDGMSAWGDATDSEITVSARTFDGKASGWSGQAHRDWDQLQPDRIVREAVDMANRTRGAMRLEPGRYTAILGPAAVGQLVRLMFWWFDVEANRGMLSPFGLENSPDGKQLRLGQRVVDERLTIWSDPNDGMGGFFPFFPDGWPSGKMLWIENGVLRTLAYNESAALSMGRLPSLLPQSIHVSGGTTTIEEMISRCERGVYVHRFGHINTAEQHYGGMVGSTRDGCFLVKNGKISHPITNFRFFESPFLMFNRLMAVGVPERVAFGFIRPNQMTSHIGDDELDGWPNLPVIVPPMMVRDFNFSSLSDAV